MRMVRLLLECTIQTVLLLLLLLVMVMVVGLILGVHSGLLRSRSGRNTTVATRWSDGVRFVRWKEVILIEAQRCERLLLTSSCAVLIGDLVIVMVGRIAATGGQRWPVPIVKMVRWNRWRIVREQLHARLLLLLHG
uniref:Uncharacterized protein n=1 Tax=Anopheles darlingi TaxID=43151 RepID=A0A2M4D1H9_ANODA